MSIHEKIQLLRKRKGWSQEELAARLSVSRQALSRWELGTAVPDTANVLRLSKVFGVSTDQLLRDEYELLPDTRLPENRSLSGPSLTARTRRLIDKRGYIAGYLLAARQVPGLLVCGLICWGFLRGLSHFAPLRELPPQAFLIPAAAAAGAAMGLGRIVFYLLLARRLKQLQRDPE